MPKVYEFYNPFKIPKVSIQKEQPNNLPPQNISQNDALVQKIKNIPSNLTPNYNLYQRSNLGHKDTVFGILSNFKNNIYKATYPQNNFDFEPWKPFDNCTQPCPKPPKPRLCPKCGLPKNMCNCFPHKFEYCFPNFVCFPVSPFPAFTPDNNFQFGINFSNISMPQYDNFQSQKSFMFWLGKSCYC